METRANHVWVGAVTLALLAIVAAFVIWIARLGEGNRNEYDIFFKQSVDGLSKGSGVTFSGVPVGQVDKIELWRKDPSFVRVRIKIDEGVPILQGVTATMQGSFTGVSNIQLEGAVKGAPPLVEPGPEGAPVIPTKRGGLGELLNSAPVLLERLATLTERLTLVLSDDNQKSIQNILANTDRMTGSIANASPQFEAAMAELQTTLVQARATLASFEKVANSTDQLVNGEGQSLAESLRKTLKSAEGAANSLNAAMADVKPVTKQLNESTLPAAEAAIRDLRATTRALRDVTEKIDEKGAGGLLGGDKLPDYKP
ncbi:phospholipid/cholesterol/gamma-HCH transport system substrate-binding protein [Novosphingobium kunmingense]|uniref:Phospholipid/cholesterol/gamma-HCH transport system substrate-binding protein n=1 Tax=Novosphingobium kunmingense TaxID=1211806 RepID=A0A2N0HKK0_9SPHN|nr:MlaD family protein [Novosphingobium kunmingense]PKB19480.1 phospholipid/cholesterol/gamma-HCH transport system substrate-binding protein [Novosphingobium kunmingense]